MCISKLLNFPSPGDFFFLRNPQYLAKHSPRLEDAYEDLDLVVIII